MPTRTLFLIAGALQVAWGLVPAASQIVIREIPIELYITLRWTISGLFFLAYLILSKTWTWPTPVTLTKTAALGILGYGVASFGTLYGLKIGGITHFAFLSALNPILTSLVSVLILRERPSKKFYGTLIGCVIGLGFLAYGKYELSGIQSTVIASACIIGATILEALAFTFSKRFQTSIGTIQYLTVAQLSTAAFMWFFQITHFHQVSETMKLSLPGWAALLFVSIVACVFFYAVLYWLLKHMDGHRLALFDSLHSVSAIGFGWLLFREPFNLLTVLGGFLILGSLYAQSRNQIT